MTNALQNFIEKLTVLSGFDIGLYKRSEAEWSD